MIIFFRYNPKNFPF